MEQKKSISPDSLLLEKIVTLLRLYSACGITKKFRNMKIRISVIIATFTLTVSSAIAQNLPKKVTDVEIFDLDKNRTKLPHFGEKNLMIFYIDPDVRKQNEAFTYELEESHRTDSPEIYGFGIINAKDTWYPNGPMRSMARKRTEKNGALVLMDDDRVLPREWGLGDCNDQFVLLFVNKAGELVFMRKGELSEQDKQDFYKLIEKYK